MFSCFFDRTCLTQLLVASTFASIIMDEIRKTLERVLNELLLSGNQVLDNVYMDKMITHLSGKNGEGMQL